MVLIYASVLLALLYAVLIFTYRIGWKRQDNVRIPQDFIPATPIAVIVPARNEEANIRKCIESVLNQNYPRYLVQLIVVDDHSTDSTPGIVSSYSSKQVHCLRLADYPAPPGTVAFKKRALDLGIRHAAGADLIITTDADCTAPSDWLRAMAFRYEQVSPVAIIAPVAFTTTSRTIEVFQCLDFISMQGITAAAHALRLGAMGNGANLAFQAEAFRAVEGYAGVDHLASGDDFLLLHKLSVRYPGRIAYLKSQEAIVSTSPQPTWGDFLQQRIRWASKSGKYSDHRLTAVLLLVYLFNLSLFLLAVACVWQPGWLLVLLGLLVFKTMIESWFLHPVLRWFGLKEWYPWFPLLQPLHVLYIVMAGFLGFWGNYHWKGRKVH